ncbi:S8 family serine peptidase [Streptomyces sp. NPDC058001]|uniref:S8 family peptidase n=1 Tax=Streptomyces sp. NPDC058001 TaxID=3346300 RepID=UPI0036EE3EDC
MKRACVSTIAAAAAVALAAGMTNPASAADERTTGPAAQSAAKPGQADLAAKSRITLITGDRVVLDAKGRVAGLERAKGREGIPVQTRTVDGHTLVIPFDAQRLINEGKLDRRLFDVTELNKAANRKAQKQGLRVIVGYRGTATGAKADVRSAGETQLRRSLKSLNADAVTTPKRDASELWDAVTSAQGDGARTTASGISRVWLDGVRKASLDKSVPQIGAPAAWAKDFDGKGVTIAVLDTGVDATHPDLKNQVVGEKNFSVSADAKDRYGHGTHVASIAAGTGAKSGGKYKGVAPGAKLLNGKVLSDDGYGEDSNIIAGMEWAAEQNADVVNLSLGGPDSPEVDPLEAVVNKLSAEKGILFAIAAGNEGPQSIGSPGSADAALTVGAVDKKDKLADFSSTGPRVGDGAVKPDVTAPGVSITAAAAPGSLIEQEVGQNPPGYLTIDGTSMATPHVAGAAAILKQKHPDWKYTELKGALTGTTKDGGYTPFEQGSGRIQVDKALDQTVIADPVSVSFGVAQWPHTDDAPVTKEISYRNLGTKDVTLDLKATAKDPKGRPAPAGFFTLGATKVTVPAGGKASVPLTANTKLGGTLDGAYSAYVVATGDGQSVRTAAAVDREVESYDVTVKSIDRDGKPASYTDNMLVGTSGLGLYQSYSADDPSGTATVRVPKGTYIVDSRIAVDPEDSTQGLDWIAQPKLSVTKNTTVTLDARTTKPVDITVPAQGTQMEFAAPGYLVENRDGGFGFEALLPSYAKFRTAHLGPDMTDGSLSQQWDGHWTKGAATEYSTQLHQGKLKRLATGFTKHYKASELSTVKVAMGAAASGKQGSIAAWGWTDEGGGASAILVPQKLPGTRTFHLSTSNKVEWSFDFEQYRGQDAEGFPISEAFYTLGNAQTFKAGQTYSKTFNTGVFGPRIGGDYGVFRDENSIYGLVPLFADGKTHAGSSDFLSVKTTLYKGSTKIGENDDPLFGVKEFKVPSADAAYKLTTSVKRSVKVAAATTRIDASWTFRSKKSASLTKLPVSTVRFNAAVGLDTKAPAGKTQSVPVTVQGAAAGSNLKSLSVYVSYDYGQTWKKLNVKNGKVSVKNPAKGKAISFHAKIADKKGNKSTISIYNAYYGK